MRKCRLLERLMAAGRCPTLLLQCQPAVMSPKVNKLVQAMVPTPMARVVAIVAAMAAAMVVTTIRLRSPLVATASTVMR
jgi:hypothetical protein